jgi:hypothetical protein
MDKDPQLEKRLPLENCIRHWERLLFHNSYLVDVSTRVIVEATVKWLKDYEKEREAIN